MELRTWDLRSSFWEDSVHILLISLSRHIFLYAITLLLHLKFYRRLRWELWVESVDFQHNSITCIMYCVLQFDVVNCELHVQWFFFYHGCARQWIKTCIYNAHLIVIFQTAIATAATTTNISHIFPCGFYFSFDNGRWKAKILANLLHLHYNNNNNEHASNSMCIFQSSSSSWSSGDCCFLFLLLFISNQFLDFFDSFCRCILFWNFVYLWFDRVL